VVEQVDCPVMHDVVLKGIFQGEILKMRSKRDKLSFMGNLKASGVRVVGAALSPAHEIQCERSNWMTCLRDHL